MENLNGKLEPHVNIGKNNQLEINYDYEIEKKEITKESFLKDNLSPLVKDFFKTKTMNFSCNVVDVFNMYKKAREIYFKEKKLKESSRGYAMVPWETIMSNNKPTSFNSKEDWLSFVSKNKELLKEIIEEYEKLFSV